MSVKTFKHYVIYVSLFGLSQLLTNCASENKDKKESNENVVNQEQEIIEEVEIEEVEIEEHIPAPQTYKGFIGNNAITAVLDYNDLDASISGYYYYDKYKKNISLQGDQVEWFCGPVYDIVEMNEDGIVTGTWYSINDCTYNLLKGTFMSVDGETSLDITLVNEESEFYLDPKAKILFDSKQQADAFFKRHHFLNNEINRKQGIIRIDDEEDYSMLLPAGITLYQHDGGDGFGIEPFAKIDENGDVLLDNGESISLDDFGGYNTTFYGMDYAALRFDEMINHEYLYVQGKDYNDIYVSIAELEQQGYHLEGDGYLLNKLENRVIGFYPASLYDHNNLMYHTTVSIYEKQDDKSKILFETDTEDDGYFHVNDVIWYNDAYWANVTFEHERHGLDIEVWKVKYPNINGWTKLYQNNKLVFDFYIGGC